MDTMYPEKDARFQFHGFFTDSISSMGDHFVKNSMKSMKWQKYRYNVSTKWLFT